MRPSRWRTVVIKCFPVGKGSAIGDKERVMVTDVRGAKYIWTDKDSSLIRIYDGGELIATVLLNNGKPVTRMQALLAIETTIDQRNPAEAITA